VRACLCLARCVYQTCICLIDLHLAVVFGVGNAFFVLVPCLRVPARECVNKFLCVLCAAYDDYAGAAADAFKKAADTSAIDAAGARRGFNLFHKYSCVTCFTSF
jgi:hypothetical protein